MKRLCIAFFAFYAVTSHGGPNWEAIERAREAKAAEKSMQTEEVVQRTLVLQKQQSALEKLQAACDKVEGNAEITAACHEIIALHAELTRSD
jgi:hypothetical protein